MTTEEILIKLTADADKATGEIKKLNKQFDSISKGVDKSNKSLKKSEGYFKSLGATTSSLNKQLAGLAATYLSFQGASQLIQTTAQVEDGFIGIAKTTGLTGKAFEDFEKQLLGLSTELSGVSLSELQGIAETAGQLGIQGSKDILEFTRVISMMGTATDLSAEEAATAMAQLGNSLGIPVVEFERMGSVINELSNNTTATAANLVDFAQRISGMGKTFGLTADEVFAFSATLKDVGMSAELGGTALSKVMLEMLKDTEAFAKASGVSFAEFSDILKNEPVKALELFIGSLSKLDKAAKVKTLDDLKLKSSGVTQTMLKLSGNTELLSRNLKIAGEEWKTNTSLLTEYDVASQSLNAQWQQVANSFTVLAYKIGKELLPMMKDLIDSTTQWVSSLDDDAIKRFGEGIGTIAKGVIGMAKALAFINDIAVPDVLGGKDAGLLDTAAEGWGRIGENMSHVAGMVDALNAFDALLSDTSSVERAVASFDGLSSTYDSLAATLTTLLAENIKLQNTFANDSSGFAAEKLAQLRSEQERLLSISQQLATQRPLDSTEQSAKSATDSLKDVAKEADNIENVEVVVDLKDETYSQKMKRLRSEGEKDPIQMKLEADTKKATASIKATQDKAKKPTASKHTIKIDDKAARAAIENLKKPTSSVHTIYEKIVRTGGGGTAGGAAASAVSGISPPPPASGGMGASVASAPMSAAQNTATGSLGNLGTLTLKVGDSEYPALVPSEVAKALQNYINSDGGL